MFDLPLQIDRGHRTCCGPKFCWRNPPSRHTGFNLWFIVEGEGTLQTARNQYNLHPGDCFLLRMWEGIVGLHGPAKPLVIPWICFDCLDERGHRLPPAKSPAVREHRRISDISFFDQMLRRVIDHHSEGPSHASEALQWLKTTLLEIEQHDQRPQLSGLALAQHLMVNALCANIREHPEAITGMPALAAQANCSVDHLIRVFRRHTSITPWEFVIQSRIEKAGNLLRCSSYSISQIADLLGYPDIYSFSKQFKSHTGQTPTQYRQTP
jgi:AraC family transcriptional regulator of arabinose operon